jgi:flagellar motor protein MotB
MFRSTIRTGPRALAPATAAVGYGRPWGHCLLACVIAATGCSGNAIGRSGGFWRNPLAPAPAFDAGVAAPSLAPPLIEGPPPLGMPPQPSPAAPVASQPTTPSFALGLWGTRPQEAPGPQPAIAPDQSALLQQEVLALREQLASTSSQLVQARQATATAFDPAVAAASASGTASERTAMESAARQLSVDGYETRVDGAVVRIELPADRLFDGRTAGLLPGGAAALTKVAAEVDRVFRGHFVGVEAHLDDEPLQAGPPVPGQQSAHQLTAARAAAVFDFLTGRTPLVQRQLFLVAHGSNHPVVSNATAAGRERNRRIELVVYPERISGDSD